METYIGQPQHHGVPRLVEVLNQFEPHPILGDEEVMIVSFFKSDYLDLETIQVFEVGPYSKVLPIHEELVEGLAYSVENEHLYVMTRAGELPAEWTQGFRFEGNRWVRGADS